MGGGVAVDGEVVTKAAQPVDATSRIELVSEPLKYVSRGGLKLAHALQEFDITVEGAVCLDVGASTGGFTDVLLQNGASRVYAVDVGYGQLAWTLRNDSRVAVMERTNIRGVSSLPEPIDLAVIDTSFISLRKVLPPVHDLLTDGGQVVALVKPQFEAGRASVRKGVVRDPAIWREVLLGVVGYARESGFRVLHVTRSPIRGPAGNVEFLMQLVRSTSGEAQSLGDEIARAVER